MNNQNHNSNNQDNRDYQSITQNISISEISSEILSEISVQISIQHVQNLSIHKISTRMITRTGTHYTFSEIDKEYKKSELFFYRSQTCHRSEQAEFTELAFNIFENVLTAKNLSENKNENNQISLLKIYSKAVNHLIYELK